MLKNKLRHYQREAASAIMNSVFRRQGLTFSVEMARQGTPITYIGGNHDFWLQDQFLKDVGIQYRGGSVELKLGEKKFFLAHGDNLWSPGFAQRIVNGIFQSKINIRLYRWLHPDIGLAFGNFISDMSRKKSEKKTFNSHKDYIRFAGEQFERGIDNVIIGHTHCPFYNKSEDKTFVNLGDWIHHNTYGYFDGNSLMLREWKENED